MEPIELSLDEAEIEDQPIETLTGKDAMLDTTQRTGTADGSCIAEEFVLEYSCHDKSKRNDRTLLETLPEESSRVSPSVKKPPSLSKADFAGKVTSPPDNSYRTYFSLSSPKPNLLQSPFPNNFLSPTSQTPFRALAQSTPKPSFRDDRHNVVTTPSINNQSMTEDHGTGLSRDADVHTNSPSQLRDKTQDHAVSGGTCHTTELNCKLEFSDVTFGSPSRSFELAMAREADKLCSGVERDSRTSGLGMSCLSILKR